MLISWAICAILTETGALPKEEGKWGYYARTDTSSVMTDAPWIRFPYPGNTSIIKFWHNNPLPYNVEFNLLKTLWKKEKILVTVFSTFPREFQLISTNFELVSCLYLEFGRF